MSRQIKTKAHASLKNEKKLCGAKTRSGEPCKNYAMANGRCRMHGGKSTGPKDKSKAADSQKKNKNAEKHGLFTKYLPAETMEIIDEIDTMSSLDILWNNIKIQYAAIIRSQNIMYVKDREDDDIHIIERIAVTGVSKDGLEPVEEQKIQVITAGEKQANFLQSQSRAMTSLVGMIKQYETMCESELATEHQQLRIEKLKKEIGDTSNEPIEVRLITKDDSNGS